MRKSYFQLLSRLGRDEGILGIDFVVNIECLAAGNEYSIDVVVNIQWLGMAILNGESLFLLWLIVLMFLSFWLGEPCLVVP